MAKQNDSTVRIQYSEWEYSGEQPVNIEFRKSRNNKRKPNKAIDGD